MELKTGIEILVDQNGFYIMDQTKGIKQSKIIF